MKLLARMTKLAGHWVDAYYTKEASISSKRDESCVLLIDGQTVPPETAQKSHFEVLEASEQELEILNRCSYRFLLDSKRGKVNSAYSQPIAQSAIPLHRQRVLRSQ